MSHPDRTLCAYEIDGPVESEITPAPAARDWMEATEHRYAYRCLPLVVANQAGWFISSERTLRARWDGGETKECLRVEYEDDGGPDRAVSHFGYGILTFRIPFLFRTPPGVNLWAKGPSNYVKDGIQALEGIVETDWSVSTFTMNWKLTRVDHDVRFDRGDPVCMVVPIPRGFAESLEPRQVSIDSNPELRDQFRTWKDSRREFIEFLGGRKDEGGVSPWQKHYYQGRTIGGYEFPDHQMKLDLRPFVRE